MKNKITLLFSAFLFSTFIPVFGQIKITEAKLGKGVQDRVVTEEATTFTKDSKVYFWMKTSGGTGELTVTWKSGSKANTRTLNVGGDPWRTWAYMTAYSAGDWTVSVTDDKGAVLKEMSFKVE